jgi:hypothetical protein
VYSIEDSPRPRGTRLVDGFPGKAAAVLGELAAKASEFLFFAQEFAAGLQSFKPRNDFMPFHLNLRNRPLHRRHGGKRRDAVFKMIPGLNAFGIGSYLGTVSGGIFKTGCVYSVGAGHLLAGAIELRPAIGAEVPGGHLAAIGLVFELGDFAFYVDVIGGINEEEYMAGPAQVLTDQAMAIHGHHGFSGDGDLNVAALTTAGKLAVFDHRFSSLFNKGLKY